MSKFGALLFVCSLAGAQLLSGAVSVRLNAQPGSTIEVGQTLEVTATATDSAASATRFFYQFTIRPSNTGQWAVMQDYYSTNTFPWTPTDHEGTYDIGVTAWSEATGSIGQSYLSVTVNPRINRHTPAVISSTNNPLVALYSAAPCPAGLQMRVSFKSAHTSAIYTPYKPCDGLTMNFYLGGMLASTTYTAQHFLSNGAAGPVLTHTTGSIPSDVPLPSRSPLAGPEAPTSTSYPFLLNSTIGGTNFATDLYGNVVWYRTPSENVPFAGGYLVRLLLGGTLLTFDNDPSHPGGAQFLREFDLAGNIIRTTNWTVLNSAVNALRSRQGRSQVRLNFLSHDAIRLPNGYTAVLATDEQVKKLNTGTQDVLGDMVLVLDTNWQVRWAWDAFDYLDVNRTALHVVCKPTGGGCPAEFFNTQPDGKVYTQALDWTHGNSLDYDSRDGSIVVSMRHQCWVIKINYANGKGDGHVIWRLGSGGNFALAPGYPSSDWFSGQHNAEFHSNGILTLFDNNALGSPAIAHGQAWSLNTSTMVATPIENIDLGVVSPIVGTAQLLANGNYVWQAGAVPPSQSQSFEYTPSGTLVYHEQVDTWSYRAFRISDLYTPTP
ncbi:MAG: aryl-sulfate sulfotransferase [Acidobacteriaceae bacterium]|nr:aryl-sulfate sulfotransferase [Acidobacteriaceae bacterium]